MSSVVSYAKIRWLNQKKKAVTSWAVTVCSMLQQLCSSQLSLDLLVSLAHWESLILSIILVFFKISFQNLNPFLDACHWLRQCLDIRLILNLNRSWGRAAVAGCHKARSQMLTGSALVVDVPKKISLLLSKLQNCCRRGYRTCRRRGLNWIESTSSGLHDPSNFRCITSCRITIGIKWDFDGHRGIPTRRNFYADWKFRGRQIKKTR